MLMKRIFIANFYYYVISSLKKFITHGKLAQNVDLDF